MITKKYISDYRYYNNYRKIEGEKMSEMETIQKMRKIAEQVFLGELKEEDVNFKDEEEKSWFDYAMRGLKSDRYQ